MSVIHEMLEHPAAAFVILVGIACALSQFRPFSCGCGCDHDEEK